MLKDHCREGEAKVNERSLGGASVVLEVSGMVDGGCASNRIIGGVGKSNIVIAIVIGIVFVIVCVIVIVNVIVIALVIVLIVVAV